MKIYRTLLGRLPLVALGLYLSAATAWAAALSENKSSALHLAARGSVHTVAKVSEAAENYSDAPNAEVAALLLSHGASPSAADAFGQTPLHLAAAHGNAGIVSQLLAAKA